MKTKTIDFTDYKGGDTYCFVKEQTQIENFGGFKFLSTLKTMANDSFSLKSYQSETFSNLNKAVFGKVATMQVVNLLNPLLLVKFLNRFQGSK